VIVRDGTDTMLGGEGDDIISAGNNDDQVWGGEGVDDVGGGDGDDIVVGGELQSGAGVYPFVDDTRGDTVYGGEGQDTLYFGRGDLAIGAEDADTFIVSDEGTEGAEPTRIFDFNFDEGDRLEIFYDPAKYVGMPEVTFTTTGLASTIEVLLDGNPVVFLDKNGENVGGPADVQLNAVS